MFALIFTARGYVSQIAVNAGESLGYNIAILPV